MVSFQADPHLALKSMAGTVESQREPSEMFWAIRLFFSGISKLVLREGKRLAQDHTAGLVLWFRFPFGYRVA